MSETNPANTPPGSITYTPRDPLDRLQEMVSTALRLYDNHQLSGGDLVAILELAQRAMRSQFVAFDPTAPVDLGRFMDLPPRAWAAMRADIEKRRQNESREEAAEPSNSSVFDKIRERLDANEADAAAERRRAELSESLFKDIESPVLSLSEVLDVYRLEGRAAGAQVLSTERVVAWVGDLQQDLNAFRNREGAAPWLWLQDPDRIDSTSRPSILYDCRGVDALQRAAKWLLDQRELRS